VTSACVVPLRSDLAARRMLLDICECGFAPGPVFDREEPRTSTGVWTEGLATKNLMISVLPTRCDKTEIQRKVR
jgi:hypothetical protein